MIYTPRGMREMASQYEIPNTEIECATTAAMLRQGADAVESVEEFWREVAQGYDIEPREFFEAEATKQGWSSPVAMAMHHIWKRDPKVAAKDAEIARLTESNESVAVCRKHTADIALGDCLVCAVESAEAALAAERAKVRDLEDIKQAAFDLMRGPRYGGTDEYRSPLQRPGGIDHACTVCVPQFPSKHTFVCAFCRLRVALGEEPK